MFCSVCEVSNKASHHKGGLLRFSLNLLKVIGHHCECRRFPAVAHRQFSKSKQKCGFAARSSKLRQSMMPKNQRMTLVVFPPFLDLLRSYTYQMFITLALPSLLMSTSV